GDMTFNEQRFYFQVSGKDEAKKDGYVPLSINVNTNQQNYVKLDGSARISANNLDIRGKLEVDIKDLYPWITMRVAKKRSGLEDFLQGSKGDDESQAILPVKFSGDWEQNGNKVLLTNLQLDGLDSKGAGQMTASFDKEINIDSSMHFNELDYSKWQTLIRTISEQLTVEDTNRYVIDESLHENVLPEDVNLNFELTSDKMKIGTQIWENVQVSVEMVDAALTINQLFIELPGASTLALFGVVSQSATTRNMRFEGTIETEGKSLKEVLSIFDESVKDLPDMGFEEFFIRSNMYISNDQIRLSEADVRFDQLQLGGGLVVYYDAQNPRIEADVRLQDTNFDYFRDRWREQQQSDVQDDFFLKFDKNINLNWLKRLETTIDLKINVERFTFMERSGDNAYLRLFARQGELGIYNVRFYYPEDVMEMNLTLNVQNQRPYMNLVLSSSQFDTDYFSPVVNEEKEEVADDAGQQPLETEEEPVEEETAEEEISSIMTVSPQAYGEIILAQNVSDPATELPAAAPSARGDQPSSFSVDDVTYSIDSKKNESNSKRWSEELIDMSWMEGVDGVFDISIGELRHGDNVLRGIKARASMANRQLAVQNVNFDYWGGKCEIAGTVYGGKVPGMSIGFTLYNIELEDFINSLSGYSNISGKASISGQLATSGVNFLSWLSQAEAKMVMSGRGVRVENFNLDGVVNTVKVSRTAADVLNNVNRALVNGSTRMTVDGNINVANGVLRSPGITMKSGTIIGSLTGDISVVPWTMDMAMLFQFPAISADTIPTLLVQLNGSIDEPKLTTDTSSLEAFVVKSIKQK
ncbi:MAG: AsmA-like C-terminal region-containing protein, partial [Alphaproteobacteria bacterium]